MLLSTIFSSPTSNIYRENSTLFFFPHILIPQMKICKLRTVKMYRLGIEQQILICLNKKLCKKTHDYTIHGFSGSLITDLLFILRQNVIKVLRRIKPKRIFPYEKCLPCL